MPRMYGIDSGPWIASSCCNRVILSVRNSFISTNCPEQVFSTKFPGNGFAAGVSERPAGDDDEYDEGLGLVKSCRNCDHSCPCWVGGEGVAGAVCDAGNCSPLADVASVDLVLWDVNGSDTSATDDAGGREPKDAVLGWTSGLPARGFIA